MQTGNRIYWIDNLRVIACFTVILLHISGPWVVNSQDFTSNNWTGVNIIHSITRFCVPVFLMISGYLLLDKNYTTYSHFFKNHVVKILYPFLFWTFFYVALFLSFNIYKGVTNSLDEIIWFLINSFIYGAAYHLWYVYLILALYLLIPFIVKIKNRLSRNHIAVFLILWFLMLMLAQYYSDNILLHFIRLMFGYLGYLVLGYFLKNINFKKWELIVLPLLLIAAGFVGTFYPVFITALTYNYVDYSRYYYLNINVVVLSIGVFLFVKSLNFHSKLLALLARHSFGIYFIHLVFIMLLNKLWKNSDTISLPLYVISTSFLCLLLSYVSIVLLKRVSFISRFVS